MEKYDVDHAVCQRDVSALIEQLEQVGLVTVA
jgi:hypothetical protein